MLQTQTALQPTFPTTQGHIARRIVFPEECHNVIPGLSYLKEAVKTLPPGLATAGKICPRHRPLASVNDITAPVVIDKLARNLRAPWTVAIGSRENQHHALLNVCVVS
jgi:hypothetical protein